jgi:ribosomal protein S18 acetylase RimI-like enzyme
LIVAASRSERQGMGIHLAQSYGDFDEARALFCEYDASLDVDLGYQGIEEEIAKLPGKYAAPKGALFLARDASRRAIGCVGVRPFDRPSACELKRLYLRPEARGRGDGRALVLETIKFASAAGYQEMLLDSLPSMQAAIGLYRSLGFEPIPSYWNSPLPGTLYFRRPLTVGPCNSN